MKKYNQTFPSVPLPLTDKCFSTEQEFLVICIFCVGQLAYWSSASVWAPRGCNLFQFGCNHFQQQTSSTSSSNISCISFRCTGKIAWKPIIDLNCWWYANLVNWYANLVNSALLNALCNLTFSWASLLIGCCMDYWQQYYNDSKLVHTSSISYEVLHGLLTAINNDLGSKCFSAISRTGDLRKVNSKVFPCTSNNLLSFNSAENWFWCQRIETK